MKRYHLTKQVLVLISILITASLYSQPFVEVSNSLPGISMGTVILSGFNKNNDYQDILITGSTTSSPVTPITKLYSNDGNFSFSEAPASFTGIFYSSASATDYDNDGDLDFFVTGLDVSYAGALRLYRNDGTSAFTTINTGITPIYSGSVSWGDYDNDGDQDLAISGSTKEGIRKGRIYRNEGGDIFTELSVSLSSLIRGAVSWGDYDNDGDLDILQNGVLSGPVTAVFRNDGNEIFTEIATGMDGYQNGNSSWGDYDKDGDLDILITGLNYSERRTRIYRNNGSNNFTLQVDNLPQVGYSYASWGDFDNDGDLDVLVTGENSSGTISASIHRNDGNNTFVNIDAGLTGIKDGQALWCDLDKDYDLDVILTGADQSGQYIFKIYRNDFTPSNSPPAAPLNPSSTVSGANVTLNWSGVETDETPPLSMTYNVKVGTSAGGIDIISPNTSVSEQRKVTSMGNGQLGTSFIVKNLKKDEYHWSVQAVDNGFRGGDFSSDVTFTITSDSPACNLTGTILGSGSINLKWIRGNADNCILFAKKEITGTALPENYHTYIQNTIFGTGDEIGATGWFCIYKGPLGYVTVTGLEPETNYIFHVIEFDGSGGTEEYFVQSATNNPAVFKTDLFTELSTPYGGFNNASANWGDFDNDGDLDAIFSGRFFRNDGADIFTYVNSGLYENGATAYPFDYNNDGKLDILLNYLPASTWTNSIFRGNGDNTFTIQSSITLPELSDNRNALGDYDNDGDIDILMTGTTAASTNITRLYRNNGDNSFSEQTGTSFTGIKDGSALWGDFDNDSFLDIVISGSSSTGNISKLYHNNGNSTFTEKTGTSLPGLSSCFMDCGDIDNDGDLDIVIAGQGSSAKVFSNNGDNTFTDLNAGLTTFSDGACDLGDYDNDGDLDILITGWIGGGCASKIYRNNGYNTFAEQTGYNIIGVTMGSVQWGDYDKDDDLDIILLGADVTYNLYSKIYRNDITTDNIKPAQPGGLTHTIFNDHVLLQWGSVTTDLTPYNAISYNIKIGTSNNGIDIFSPHSADDGFRRLPETGNMQLGTSCIIKDLLPADYFWRVQAIDHSFAGGSFSAEDPFTVPYIQAEGLSATITSPTSLLLKWTRGNGERCIVFCKSGTTGTALPENNKTYLADNIFGYGTPIGTTDWYCIYNGRLDSVPVTGLSMNSDYVFHVIEYIGSPGNEQYYTATSLTNPGVFGTGLFNEMITAGLRPFIYASVTPGDYNNDGKLDVILNGLSTSDGFLTKLFTNEGDNTFSELAGTPFTGVHNGYTKWGDYDNDGHLDLLMGGAVNFSTYDPVTKIYHNNGDNTFTDIGAVLPGLYYSSADWGDYDNDGYLDFIIAGYTGSSSLTAIYHNNNGSGTFNDINAGLQAVRNCSVEWGDSDNDGDLDVIVQGDKGTNSAFTRLYRNDGSNVFTAISSNLPDSYTRSDLSWGDYDNDGFLDILIAGGSVTGVYRNNGNNTFTNTGTTVMEVTGASGNWGDYDNDGDLDFVITGSTESGNTTSVYSNNSNNTFTLQSGYALPGVSVGSSAWGDYDNDGDLDLFLAGISSTYIAKLFRNNTIMNAGGFTANSKPSAPYDLSATAQPGGIMLKWVHVKNDETSPKTMTYNIRIGTLSGNSNFYPAASDLTTGFRRIAKMGNAQLDTTLLIKNLPSGTYYWGVQAVDQGYMGGDWSSIVPFEVKNVQAFFTSDEACLGSPTHFTDLSDAYKGIASWYWEFGDGTTSTVQNPEHIYASSGTYNVKLTITDTESATDFLIQSVIVKSKPTTNFTAPTVCQGTATLFTNTTNDNGLDIISWFWDFGDGWSSIVQDPPAHGYMGSADYTVLLRAQADNGCIDEISKTVEVVGYPVPAISADGATSFCSGESVTLSVPFNTNYTYLWRRDGSGITGATANTYLAQITGSYTVSVTNKDICTTLSSAVPVAANTSPAAPLISAAGPITFCQGDAVDLSVTYTDGYSYQWKLNGGAVGTNSNLYSAAASGTYSLEVTNSTNCSTSSINTVDITVNPLPTIPTINISGPTTFCEGNNVELSVTNTGGYTYQWENNGSAITGAATNTYIANNSGVYSLKITNTNNCFVRTDDVTVNVSIAPAAPLISADGPVTFCQGDAVGLNVTNTTGYSYQWKLNGGAVGTNSNLYPANASGTYTLVVANSTGCSTNSTNSVAVTVNPNPSLPTVNISGATSFCEGGNVELSVTTTPGYEYQWENNGTGISGAIYNSYIAQITGNYKLKITNAYACSTKTENVEVNVSSTPAAPLISASGVQTFCQGDSVALSVTPSSDLSYQWKLNGGAVGTSSSMYTAKNEGTYSLTVSNVGGCSVSSSNTVSVTVNQKPSLPSVNISGSTTFCEGSSVELSVTPTSGYTYQWENNGSGISGSTTSTLVARNPGVYSLKITNSTGCYTKTENVTVNVLAMPSSPTISISGATTFCSGDSAILSVSNTSGYSYQWKINGGSVGDNSSQIVAKSSGDYSLVVTNSSGCSVSSVSPVPVIVNPLPAASIISVKGEEKFCSGESATLSVPANANYLYDWKRGTNLLGLTSSSITAGESGEYSVDITLAGCTVAAEPVKIEVVKKPLKPSIDTSFYNKGMCMGESPLKISVDEPVAGYYYQWYKNETPIGNATSIEVPEAGNYYLEAVYDICSSERDMADIVFAQTLSKPDIIARGPTVWLLSTTSNAAKYRWYYNGNLIPDATGNNYVAGQNYGVYRLAVSDESGCFSFSDTLRIPVGATGIDDVDPFENVKIYPNPTTGIFTIEMDNNIFGQLVIDIFTQSGSKILNIKFDKTTEYFSTQIDLSRQSKGMYLINLSLDKFTAVRKVLVE